MINYGNEIRMEDMQTGEVSAASEGDKKGVLRQTTFKICALLTRRR